MRKLILALLVTISLGILVSCGATSAIVGTIMTYNLIKDTINDIHWQGSGSTAPTHAKPAENTVAAYMDANGTKEVLLTLISGKINTQVKNIQLVLLPSDSSAIQLSSDPVDFTGQDFFDGYSNDLQPIVWTETNKSKWGTDYPVIIISTRNGNDANKPVLNSPEDIIGKINLPLQHSTTLKMTFLTKDAAGINPNWYLLPSGEKRFYQTINSDSINVGQ